MLCWVVVASQEILRGVGKAWTWPETQGENLYVRMCPEAIITLRWGSCLKTESYVGFGENKEEILEPNTCVSNPRKCFVSLQTEAGKLILYFPITLFYC